MISQRVKMISPEVGEEWYGQVWSLFECGFILNRGCYPKFNISVMEI